MNRLWICVLYLHREYAPYCLFHFSFFPDNEIKILQRIIINGLVNKIVVAVIVLIETV